MKNIMKKILNKLTFLAGAGIGLATVAGIICMILVGIQTMYYFVNDPYYYQQELFATVCGQGVLLMAETAFVKLYWLAKSLDE